MHVIVLAAGFSRRFGSPKQLYEFEGQPLIRRAATTALAVAPTIVVIPPDAPEIREALHDLDVTIIENPHAAEGIASSIRAAVARCDDDILITLCDQPHITPAHLHALAEAPAPLAATAYANSIGVPARFNRRFREELLALHSDNGAKSVLEAHRDEVATIKFAGGTEDIDMPLDVASQGRPSAGVLQSKD
jgi:Uncharacterized MobA-related protein